MPDREQMLDKSAAVFLERGFMGSSVEDLARDLTADERAELQRVGGKSKLAAAIVVHAFRGMPMLPNEDRPGAEVPALERLVMLCRGVAGSIATNPTVRAAFRLISERQLIDADIPKPLVTWLVLIEGLFEEAAESGDLPENVAPADAAWHMVTTFHGVKDAAVVLDQLDELVARVDTLLRINLLGLGVDAERVAALLPEHAETV